MNRSLLMAGLIGMGAMLASLPVHSHYVAAEPAAEDTETVTRPRFRNLTPEERAERRERFRNLPPEERAARREEFRNTRPRQRRAHQWRGDNNNPPGRRGGPGTNWENPRGRRGGPGASPDRRRFRTRRH